MAKAFFLVTAVIEKGLEVAEVWQAAGAPQNGIAFVIPVERVIGLRYHGPR